jgi:hypothetical protein
VAAAHGVPGHRPPPVSAATSPMSRGPRRQRGGLLATWRPGPAWYSRDGHMLAGVGRLGSMRDPDTARRTVAELRGCQARPGVLAAIRICPLAATKKIPWPSQSVTGFASRRTATLP